MEKPLCTGIHCGPRAPSGISSLFLLKKKKETKGALPPTHFETPQPKSWKGSGLPFKLRGLEDRAFHTASQKKRQRSRDRGIAHKHAGHSEAERGAASCQLSSHLGLLFSTLPTATEQQRQLRCSIQVRPRRLAIGETDSQLQLSSCALPLRVGNRKSSLRSWNRQPTRALSPAPPRLPSSLSVRATWQHPVGTGGDPVESSYMAWLGRSAQSHESLLQHLQLMGVLSTEHVMETMRAVDRTRYVGQGNKAYAYADSPQPIGYNATISAPHMHAQCLELLEPFLSPSSHALDVGSGTGYLTACFALMVGEHGKAVGVEHIPELVQMSIQNVLACPAARPFWDARILELHAADGRKGWAQHAPYQAIHVGAAAPVVPPGLLSQLSRGGRMVIPVGTYFQDLRVIDRLEDGTLKEFTAADVRYVPLTDKHSQLAGG